MRANIRHRLDPPPVMPFAVKRLLVASSLLMAAAAAASDEDPVITDRSGRVPAYILELPASVPDVLIADASSSSLIRVENVEGRPVAREARYLSVGLRGVGKQEAWDRKSPLGIYFITEELDTRRLDPKYGALAFVLDYPNAWDRHRQRTGYGIWLHGVHPDSPVRPPRDTDGCLALPNDALISLKPRLRPLRTPVVVAREALWLPEDALRETRGALKDALENWRRSVETRDLYAYLQNYDSSFSARGLDRDGWARFRMQSFAASDAASATIDDLLLLADPEEPGLYLARFRLTLAGTDTVTYRKRLYWRRGADGFRIVTEDAG